MTADRKKKKEKKKSGAACVRAFLISSETARKLVKVQQLPEGQVHSLLSEWNVLQVNGRWFSVSAEL